MPEDNCRPSHDPAIRVAEDGWITTVTIDNPTTRNACTGDMWVALGATFRDLGHSPTRAIILTGAGEDFCAGADLSSGGRRDGREGDGARPRHILHAMRVLGDVVQAVHDCPVPVIARVDGVCVGAGLGLALAADMVWCSDRARFSAIFVKRGISMDFGTSWLLRQRIGVHRAKELAFTGRMVGGAEAMDLGLVNAVVPVEDLDAATWSVARSVADGPPIAISLVKRALDHAGTASLAQAVEAEAVAQSLTTFTADMREAMTAYHEKRTPTFEDR